MPLIRKYMMLPIIIFILIFASVALVSSQIIPYLLNKFQRPLDKKIAKTEKQLDTMFVQVERKKLIFFYLLPIPVLGMAGFVIFNNLFAAFLGAAAGFALPPVAIKALQARRKARFQSQLLDGILIISSSLKGGLSLLQALEVLVEEMPAPISQEFGLVLRENKIGITLDESLKLLKERINIPELGFLINSILVARETGGDLPRVLGRLTTSIRDSQKLKENIKTLTLQGRLQGFIMSCLPFVFLASVLSFNRSHFDIMLQTDIGRALLFAAAILQALGIFLIHKFSMLKI